MNATTSEHDSRWAELLPLYALGALEGQEHLEVEQHLASGCSSCAAELEELEMDLELLAESAAPVDPSPLSWRRLEKELGPSPRAVDLAPAAKGGSRPSRWLWPLAAAVVAALGAGLFDHTRLSSTVASLDGQKRELSQQLQSAELRIGDLERERTQLARELATVTSPKSRQVVLAGLNSASDASGFAYFDRDSRRARFYAFDLPELPSEKDYQLWVIADGKPISAGLLKRAPDGSATVDVGSLPAPDTISTWAVTIEPAGGLPQPSGSMVLAS